MCSLCGVLLNESWAEQAGGRRARAFVLRLLNRVLSRFGLRLDEWAGSVYVLRDRTGRTAVVEDLSSIWREAEQLAGTPARPARSRPPRHALPKTPVTLVTGFLGSGKTTLISRLLGHPDMGETAVIVNELGEVGIDHHLLRRVDERTVLLRSGCVCCTLRGDLAGRAARPPEPARARRDSAVSPCRGRDNRSCRSCADRLHAPVGAGRPAPLRARDRRGDGRRRQRSAPRGVAEAGRRSPTRSS